MCAFFGKVFCRAFLQKSSPPEARVLPDKSKFKIKNKKSQTEKLSGTNLQKLKIRGTTHVAFAKYFPNTSLLLKSGSTYVQ